MKMKPKLRVESPPPAEIEERVMAIVEDLKAKHTVEKTVYTTCICNCGGNGQCVIKAHVKDGMVTAVEPDDRYNPNIGMEDKVLSEQDLIRTRLQRRPCVMGYVFPKHLYNPNRVLYPLSTLLGGDFKSCSTTAKPTTLVQVERL